MSHNIGPCYATWAEYGCPNKKCPFPAILVEKMTTPFSENIQQWPGGENLDSWNVITFRIPLCERHKDLPFEEYLSIVWDGNDKTKWKMEDFRKIEFGVSKVTEHLELVYGNNDKFSACLILGDDYMKFFK